MVATNVCHTTMSQPKRSTLGPIKLEADGPTFLIYGDKAIKELAVNFIHFTYINIYNKPLKYEGKLLLNCWWKWWWELANHYYTLPQLWSIFMLSNIFSINLDKVLLIWFFYYLESSDIFFNIFFYYT